MKTGVIVYATGAEPEVWDPSNVVAAIQKKEHASAVELITVDSGHFDIADAWRSLVVRGMARVICRLARFNELGELELTNREMRLCG